MTKAEELKEALIYSAHGYTWDEWSTIVAGRICDTLGITRELVNEAHTIRWLGDEDPKCPQCRLNRAVITLLEVAGR